MVKRFFERFRPQVPLSHEVPEGLLLEGTVEPVAVEVLIADLDGREGREVSARLAQFLAAFPGLAVRATRKRPRPPFDAGLVERLTSAGSQGRALLAQEGGEVLIWGEVTGKDGAAVIRFLPLAPDAEGKTGTFGLGDSLELPPMFGEEVADIVGTSALAAAVAVKNDDDETFIHALSAAAGRISGYAEVTPPGLMPGQLVTLLTCIGNCFAALWRLKGEDAHLDRAVQVYGLALESCPPRVMPIAHALIQNHLAAAFEAQAARSRDPEPLERAMAAYRAVTEVLDPTRHSQDWAFAQNRLGMTCYRLALRSGHNSRHLKAAIRALETARQVFTREDAPDRWAEVTNQLGVAEMDLGVQLTGPEVLERAVGAFREALEVRHQDSAPLLWAQTANNLGAALFALYRRKEIPELLEEAAKGFEGAHAVYSQFGEQRTVEIIEKNLTRVRALIKAKPKPRPKVVPRNGRRR